MGKVGKRWELLIGVLVNVGGQGVRGHGDRGQQRGGNTESN